jgi:hypothetical protein
MIEEISPESTAVAMTFRTRRCIALTETGPQPAGLSPGVVWMSVPVPDGFPRDEVAPENVFLGGSSRAMSGYPMHQ